MNTGQRTVAGMLAVVAVMLGLNLIVRGSPTAVAQEPEIRIFPEPPVPEPTVVAGATLAGGTDLTFVWRFWSDGTVDWSRVAIFGVGPDCDLGSLCGPPIVVIPSG